MPHGGGLLHLAFSLFHQKEAVRDATVDLFNHATRMFVRRMRGRDERPSSSSSTCSPRRSSNLSMPRHSIVLIQWTEWWPRSTVHFRAAWTPVSLRSCMYSPLVYHLPYYFFRMVILLLSHQLFSQQYASLPLLPRS
ncbi:hypothetical protein B0H10DRAFT_784180 [Mycena sp. CBHHK59/15]|nr:hypothetical protein B0H10DRAFT_784180 [Mycena sp. CBHHK59/15]